MTRLDEFLLQGGLFEQLENINPLPFLGDGQNEVMDRLLALKYGGRLLYTKIAPLTFTQIAEMLSVIYGDKWDLYITIGTINTLDKETRTVTETINNVENRNGNTDNKNLISAYNDDSLIVNDGSTSINSDDMTGNKTRTLTDSKTDLQTAYKNLSLSDKNNIMNLVLHDVADFLTLSIY